MSISYWVISCWLIDSAFSGSYCVLGFVPGVENTKFSRTGLTSTSSQCSAGEWYKNRYYAYNSRYELHTSAFYHFCLFFLSLGFPICERWVITLPLQYVHGCLCRPWLAPDMSLCPSPTWRMVWRWEKPVLSFWGTDSIWLFQVTRTEQSEDWETSCKEF